MKHKWWLVLCLTTSFLMTGCADTGGSSSSNAAAMAAQSSSYFSTPTNLQPLENNLAQVGIVFAIGGTTNVNGQQMSVPVLNTQYFQSVYPGPSLAMAQSFESQYVYTVQSMVGGASACSSGSYSSYNPYGSYGYGAQIDLPTFFALCVKMQVVQGLMQGGSGY